MTVVAILLFISPFVSTTTFAASKTVYSIVSVASWTNGNHWSHTSGGAACSCTPNESKDIIYIETNTGATSDLKFGSSVTIVVRNNSTFTINGDVEFENGSNITIETGSQIIINGKLKNKNNSNHIQVDGTITINGEFEGENGSTITGIGSLSTTGKAITNGSATVFGFTNDCATGPCFANAVTPLPVKLISFTTEANGNKVSLQWSTASEINNDHFVIEKSLNGIDFSILTNIKGAGNSNSIKQYSYNDSPVNPGTIYYRLKQIDFDGKYEYLEVKAVSIIGTESSCDIFVKPNPCVGRCEVSFENCQEEEYTDAKIMLFDAVGNAVYSSVSKQVSNGRVSFELNDNNNLRPAVYFIKGSVNNKLKSKRVILAK